MCDTDLDLDLVLNEDAQVQAAPPVDGQYAGVAWGRAEAGVAWGRAEAAVKAAHSG
jgi:hypothetical protein